MDEPLADITSHDTYVQGIPRDTFQRQRRDDPVHWTEESDEWEVDESTASNPIFMNVAPKRYRTASAVAISLRAARASSTLETGVLCGARRSESGSSIARFSMRSSA